MLPTPTVSEANGADNNTGTGAPNLRTTVRDELLPTPRAARGTSTTEVSYALGGERIDDDRPQGEVVFLPTPAASLGTAGHTSRSGARKDEPLLGGIAEQIAADALLPTPLESEGVKPSNTMGTARRLKTGQVFLTNVIVDLVGLDDGDSLLPTPTARDHKDSGDFTPHPEKRKLAHTIVGELLPTPNAGQSAARRVGVNWGKYGPAITRAEHVAGREAPAPTNPDGRDGKHRLASRFVEWMMLLHDGHVTGRGLSRAQELARLGNGVVPLQAAASVAVLLERLAADKRSGRRE